MRARIPAVRPFLLSLLDAALQVAPVFRRPHFRSLVSVGLFVLMTSLSVLLFASPQTASASTGIESEMSFEGKIVSSTGQNIPDGTYNMEFRIYTGCTNEPAANTGCTPVWSEDYLNNNTQGVTFTSGTYQVNLGSICTFAGSTCESNVNSAVNWDSYPLYLSLQIGNTSNCSTNNPGSSLFTADCGGDGAMNPYILLTSTPYAMDANNADNLGGVAASGYVRNAPTATQTIQAAGNTTGLIVEQNAGGTYSSDIFDVQGTGGSADNFLQVTSSAANTGNVNIQGIGSSSTASVQAGSGGVITIGNQAASTANTINIGSTSTNANADTVNINTESGNTGSVNIGGTGNATGTITVGESTGTNTINIGSGYVTSGHTQTIDVGTAGSGTGVTSVYVGSTVTGSSTGLYGATEGQVISGAGDIVQSYTNNSAAFEVQNASSVNLLDVDTSGGNVNLGIGGSLPPFGYSTIGGTADTGFYQTIHASRFSATYTGTISSMSVYVGASGFDTTNKSYQVALYADTTCSGNPCPGAYIASSAVGTLGSTAGWNTLAVSASLTAGTTYWLAYWSNTSNANTNKNAESYNNVGGGNANEIEASTATTWQCSSSCTNGMPTTFPANPAIAGYTYSIYATYGTGNYALTLNNAGSLYTTGAATFQDASNSATAFQVQNATGGNVLTADSVVNDTTAAITVGTTNSGNSQQGIQGNSYSGNAIQGNSTSGTGVIGQSGSNNGVYGYSTSGNGVSGASASGHSAYFQSSSATDSAATLFVQQQSTSTANLVQAMTYGGATLFSLGSAGATVFENSANSGAAFQIQNATAVNLFNVDTSGNNIELGVGGTPPSLGYTTVGGNVGSGYNGTINANEFTATYTGPLSSMSAYVGSPQSGTLYQMALYTNNAGVPGSYIASTATGTFTSSANWYSANFTSNPTVTAGTTYWLVYWTNVSNGTNDGFNNNNPVTGATYYYASATWASGADNGMPATFPAGTNAGTYQHSVYATYASTGYAVAVNGSGAFSATGAATFVDASNSTTAFQVQNATGYAVLSTDTTHGYTVLGSSSSVNGALVLDNSSNSNTITISSGTTSSSYTLTLPTALASSSGQCLDDSTGTGVLSWTSCGGASLPIVEVNEKDGTGSGTTGTLSGVTAANAGDLMVVYVDDENTSGYTVTGVSLATGGTGNTTSFSKVNGIMPSGGYGPEMWEAQVTSAGTLNIKASFSASTSYEIVAQDFTATGVTTTTQWNVVNTATNVYTGSSSTLTWPSLNTNSGSNEAYAGYGFPSTSDTTTGCTTYCYAKTTASNVTVWRTGLSANTAYQPTASMNTAGQSNSVGAILVAYGGATVSGGGSGINNQTTVQSANFNVQAATSGSVAGTLEANAAGTGDVLDLENGSGVVVDKVTSTGNLVVNPSAASATAFQVQNSGVALLTADTSNSRIDIGTAGTATGQLYVAGTVASAVLSTTTTNGAATDVKVAGNYAYVISNSAGAITVYDVTNPASPTADGVFTTTSGYTNGALAIAGKYAYITQVNGTNYQIQVVNVSNPNTLSSPATLSLTGNPKGIYAQGKYLYVVLSSTNKLDVIDISNPASPVLVGSASVTAGNAPQDVYVQGRYAYVTSYSTAGFQIFDIANPSNPTSVGSLTTGLSAPYDVYVQGRYAYITNNNASASPGETMQVIDVSNPSTPALTGTSAQLGSGPAGIYVQGRYAYVATYNANTFTTIDVSTPASPVVQGTALNVGSYDPLSLVVQGRYAYIADGGASKFQIVDLGGEYAQQLQAGGTETGTLSVDNNETIYGDSDIQGGLTVGENSEFNGDVGVSSAETAGTAVNVNANGLTTGYGVNVTTTSAVQTAGSLVNLSNTATLTTSGGSDTASLINVSRALTANVTTGGGTLTPTFDHGATFSTYPGTVTQTDTFTVNSGHSNYYLFVGVFEDKNGLVPTSVTYGGVAMTQLKTGGIGGGGSGVTIFGLTAPVVGTNNLVITGSQAGEWMTAVSDWYNVGSIDTVPTEVSAATNPSSITVTTTSGDVVEDFFASTVLPDTQGSGQTLADYSGSQPLTYGPGAVGQSYLAATTTSTTMHWSGSTYYGYAAIGLKGATASGSETVSGAVASFSSSCTITSGSCADATNVLSLNQQYAGSTGAVLNLQNSGAGDMIDFSNSTGLVGSIASANGNLNVQTANNATGTAGSITLDTGTSGNVITGSVENATFESGTQSWANWFNTSVAQSTTKAHGGTHSLAITSGTGNTSWGVQSGNTYPVAAGTSYTFSAWVYLPTADTIDLGVQWGTTNSSFPEVATEYIPANTWTQIAGSATAPSADTVEELYISNDAQVANSTLIAYIDDINVSGGVTAPALDLGSANAQTILIGNSAQSGGTTLMGGNAVQQTISGAGDIISGIDSNNSYAQFEVIGYQSGAPAAALTVDTIDQRVIIGAGSTGEAAAQILVLDSQNTATDPTEVNGAMYYNSNTGVFRCGQGGAWTNCIATAQSWSVGGVSASGTTTSTTYAAWPGSNNAVTFTKSLGTTKLLVHIDVEPWNSSTSNSTNLGVDVNISGTGGGTFACGQLAMNNEAVVFHEELSCSTTITGVASGSHTATIYWARLSGTGTPNTDATTWGDMSVQETN